jgi:DnaJ-class molecular chaperone
MKAQRCPTCNGKTKIRDPETDRWVTCPGCEGWGWIALPEGEDYQPKRADVYPKDSTIWVTPPRTSTGDYVNPCPYIVIS